MVIADQYDALDYHPGREIEFVISLRGMFRQIGRDAGRSRLVFTASPNQSGISVVRQKQDCTAKVWY